MTEIAGLRAAVDEGRPEAPSLEVRLVDGRARIMTEAQRAQQDA